MNEMRVLKSVCPLDCPDTCALNISIQGQEMIQVGGQKEHPATQGFACAKMAKYPLRQHHPDRLLYPLKRVGRKGDGRFERIDWETALNLIADRLRTNIDQHGEQSVLPFCYAGTMGVIEQEYPLAFFRALGARELEWTICAATAGAAWEANYGPRKVASPPESMQHSKLILLWGVNSIRSNSHAIPHMMAARRNGAHILHIDPYRNETSRFADEHWQVKVGTDAALALAIGGEILRNNWQDDEFLEQFAEGLDEYRRACGEWPVERAAEYCGIAPQDIKRIATLMGHTPETHVRIGYGMTRNEGGGNAARAVTLLPALLGSWKHLGGGGALSTSGAFTLNTHRLTGQHLRKPDRRVVNQNFFGSALNSSSDPISTLFVFNSNPAAVAPDSGAVCQGLEREDLFTVVLEHFQTDTADYADILLPATTFVEHPDVYKSYGHYYLQWAEPLLAAAGECKPNSWVFQQLAKRLRFQDPVFGLQARELLEEMLDTADPILEGITAEALIRERSLPLNLNADYRPYAKGSHFPDGKIRFYPAPTQIEFQASTSSRYPLRLISPPGAFILNTSMGNLEPLIRAAGGEPTVVVHPDDACEFGVQDGERINIESPRGMIQRKVIVSTDARQGVVVALGQWWPKLAPDKKSLNELTEQGTTDLGGGSLFGNAVVAISPVATVST